jgi:hypothetical protein
LKKFQSWWACSHSFGAEAMAKGGLLDMKCYKKKKNVTRKKLKLKQIKKLKVKKKNYL